MFSLDPSLPSRSPAAPLAPEVSVVLAVRCCEELIGGQVRAIASQLTALRRSFEIVAVNDGCRDNSLSVLALLAREMPELKIVHRDVSGRALTRGAVEASGTYVVLCPAPERPANWAPLGWALSRLESEADAVVLRGRYVVARRLPVLPVIARARGHADRFELAFERSAQQLPQLRTVLVGARRALPGLLSPVRRWVASFVP